MPPQTNDHLPENYSNQPGDDFPVKCQISLNRLHAGMTCPHCGSATLDYNGLLQLVCPNCGLIETGVST